MGRLRRQGTRHERLGDDRSTRVIAPALVVLAALVVAFPGGGTAAPGDARDITARSKIVSESFAVSLPNDPNRCVVSFFVEFPDVRGATSYTALILNSGFNPPQQQTFSAAPPNFPHDAYTVFVGGQTKTFFAPSGFHRIFVAGFSSGQGCAGEPWVSIVKVTADGVGENEPPVAGFTWKARDGEPLTVDFDASASTDDDAIESYSWDFGDGGAGSGITSSHPFAEGTYDVTLTVTDTDGETDSQTQRLTVTSEGGGGGSESPVAAFTATASQSDPYGFLLDGSGSTDDGRIVSYDWDFGDGASGSGVTAPHTFAGHGTYDVSLTVTDDEGLEDELTQPVLANAPPEAQLDWQPSQTNQLAIEVDAGRSTDDSAIDDYAWNFGDGTTGSGSTATHEYASSGSYTVTLVVTDDDGAQTTTSAAAFVTGGGGYRLELPEVYGEEADLLLDEDGQVVAVECSLGSALGVGMNVISNLFGDDFDPDCVSGAIGVSLTPVLGHLFDDFADAFNGAKLFPESTSGKSLAQIAKAFDIENVSEVLGSIQERVDKMPLPPAQDGVISVTPDKKTSKDLSGMMTTFADGFQRTTQGLSGLKAMTERLKELTPQTP